MPKSAIIALRAQLLDEVHTVRTAIMTLLQQTPHSGHTGLLLQLEQHAISHWPELLYSFLTPELDQLSHRLEALQAALSQMDMGMYGLCCDCDSKIEADLLRQDPARQRCARCEGIHLQAKPNCRLR